MTLKDELRAWVSKRAEEYKETIGLEEAEWSKKIGDECLERYCEKLQTMILVAKIAFSIDPDSALGGLFLTGYILGRADALAIDLEEKINL